MKKLSKLIYLMTLTLIISSCTEKEEPIGKWDDNIKLSTKKVEFDSSSKSVTITTEGDWWWVIGVSVNDEEFGVPEDINLESESYVIEQDCFRVEKIDNNTLYVEIDENISNTERTIIVELEAGNYFDRVIITQSAG